MDKIPIKNIYYIYKISYSFICDCIFSFLNTIPLIEWECIINLFSVGCSTTKAPNNSSTGTNTNNYKLSQRHNN